MRETMILITSDGPVRVRVVRRDDLPNTDQPIRRVNRINREQWERYLRHHHRPFAPRDEESP